MIQPITSAIVLAGGLGTRLRSVVPELPKPMAPVGGRPFLTHQLDYWIAQGVTRFILAVSYRHEAIVDFFGNTYRGATVDYVVERTPLGTGGGLFLAAEHLVDDSPFVLLNGDTYFAVELHVLSEFAEAHDADWCFSLFRTREVGRYQGIDMSPEGRVISLESRAAGSDRLASGGVYWVHPRALLRHRFVPGGRVSLEDEILPVAIASGQRLFGVEFSGTFVDIGVPDDYARAQTLLSPRATL